MSPPCSSDGAGGGLYVAFNTSHLPKILALPKWGGRVWQPVVDTSKLAPFDCLMPDEVLSQKEVRAERKCESV